MTELLLRLFLKKDRDMKDPNIRLAVGKLAGATGIGCNVLLFAGKLLAGLLSGSISIVADAMNNLSDAASSVVTLLGFRMAQRPADAEHPYGHARYEYLSGLAVAVFICVMGLQLIRSSVEKIITPSAAELSLLTLCIMLASMGIKLWMAVFFRTLGKKIDSAVLEATSTDSRNDVITTGAVLVGCLVEFFADVSIDGYMGLGVALFILWSGVRITRETVSPLLGRQCSPELLEHISALVHSYPEVLGVHDLLVHDYGPGQCFATIHVELSAALEPLVCHDLIDDMERQAQEKLGVNLVIHYDPVVTDDPEWNDLREKLHTIIHNIHPELSMHDFRLLREGDRTKLCFDLAVPYAMNEECASIREKITEAMNTGETSYELVIRFDGKA